MIVSPASATHSPSGSSARQNPWNSGGRSGAVDASPCRTRKSLTACWTIRRAGSRSPPHGAAGDELELRLDLARSEEHPSELQSIHRISYAVLCLKKKTNQI